MANSDYDKVLDMIGQKVPIYDRYLPTDFAPGQDNLNPLREIDASSLYDLENAKVQLYIAYKAKLDKLIESGIQLPGTKSNSEGAGAYSGAVNAKLSVDDTHKVSTTVTLVESSPNTGVSASARETVLQLLGALESLLGADALTLDDLPFDLCADRGLGGFASGKANSTNKNASSTSNTTNNSSNISSSAATGTAIPAISKTDSSNDAVKCLQLELEFLAIIVALLNIVKVVMTLERYVLSVIWPIINIITMVCSVWLNPAMISKLIQYLAGMGMSMLIHIMLLIVKMLIDSLNLDCLISGSVAAVSQIMGTLGGVQNLGSDLKSFVDFNNPDKFKNLVSQVVSPIVNSPTTKTLEKDGLSGLLSIFAEQAANGMNAAVKDTVTGASSYASGTLSSLAGSAATTAAAVSAGVSDISTVVTPPETTATVSGDTATVVGDYFPAGFDVF